MVRSALLLGLLLGCQDSGSSRTGPAECPDVETLATLHTVYAAVDRRSPSDSLGSSRKKLDEIPLRFTKDWNHRIARTRSMLETYRRDPTAARMVEEELRAELHDSPCLSRDIHQALHSPNVP